MSDLNLIGFLKTKVQERVLELLEEAFQLTEVDPSVFKFEMPPDEKMGHLAFACFPLAKTARKAPPMIATALAENWGETPWFSEIKAIGPYLNFFFSPAYLAQSLVTVCAENSSYGNNNTGQEKTVMVEYSSPNTNKPLHLGHCRNNLLGIVLWY